MIRRRGRLPVLLQAELTECGLACVAMIAAFHGKPISMCEARQQIMLSSKGATLADLIDMASALAFESRGLRVEIEDLRELRLPCILHWNMNHFVVLTSLRRTGVTIHDPAEGLRHISWREFDGHFTGVALELWPSGEFVRHSGRQGLSRFAPIAKYCLDAKSELGWILLSAFALEALSIAMPFHLRWAIDRGLVSSSHARTLAMLSMGFALLVVIQAAICAVRGWLVAAISAHLNLRWLSNVFSHLMRLPLAWFERRHPGAVQSNFGSVQQIQQMLSTRFAQTIVDGVMVIGTMAMMLSYSVAVSAVSVGAASLYLASRWLSFRAMRDVKAEEIAFSGKQNNHFLETLRGIQTVRLYGQVPLRTMHWLNLLVHQFNAGLRGERILAVQRAMSGLLFGLERIGAVWIGALAVIDSRLTVGMLFALVAYREQFSTRVAGLIDCIIDLRMLAVHVERVADITDQAPEPKEAVAGCLSANDRDHLDASVELRGVSFRYAPSEPWVLKRVDLRIEPGESVAITGPSGGGKSTLAKILLGLLEPVEGEVLFGGRRIDEIGLTHFRRLVGTVMQDDTVFGGTIADNISFFAADVDMARIEACAALAAMDAEIDRMPMGYDSLVGAGGCLLSGGQRQRLLLARALYKQPRVLLLDEATSHLDTANETAINAAVRAMQLTRIVIAHRPQTIASAQRVFRLEHGRIQAIADAEPQRGGDTGAIGTAHAHKEIA